MFSRIPTPRGTWSLALALCVFSLFAGASRAVAADDDAKPEAQKIEAATRTRSVNNLKHLMLAMHNYHDQHNKFPPAYSSAEGKPLLSWRVALLPYLEFKDATEVWQKFHLDEPWDSPHNKPLAESMPQVFQSPRSKLNDGRTVYLTPRWADSAFPGEKGVAIKKITDGTSNTIAILEVDDELAVPWTKPDDLTIDRNMPSRGLGKQFPPGFNAAFCDGSVHILRNQLSDDTLRQLLTISGGELVILPD